MKRKKRLIALLVILAFFLVFFITAAEFTSRSKFCSTCHYMKPFYQSWESSSHKEVECRVCHYPPGIQSKFRAKIEGLLQVGRYWTKLYLKSKPWAEISDESCLRPGCHEKRLLEGSVKFQKIVFDHKIHFEDLKRGKSLRCTSCHSQIVQGEHITVTESTCFICHFKESDHYPKISECSHCHHKEDLASERSRYNHSFVFDNGFHCDKCHSQTIIGDGAVPGENCYKCHWETDRLNKYEDTDLMHSTHITSHKIECNLCHLEIQHKIVKEIETIADCRACHTDSHLAQKILFSGEGGKGVAHSMPNIMLEKGLSCKGCHIFHEESGGRLLKSQTYISKPIACESCHGKGYANLLRMWEDSTSKKLAEIKNVYRKACEEAGRIKNGRQDSARVLLDEAAFNIDIVERGKSVHNINYSQELLKASFEKIEEALELINSSYKPNPLTLSPKELPSECTVCHTGIEEINTYVFGLNFPHKSHLLEQKLNCSNCHSNVRKHGEFIASRSSCASCHHREAKTDCGSCHEIQRSFYQGGKLNSLDIPQDTMAEAGLGCTDCHLNRENQIFRTDADKCAECHEESYRKIYDEWKFSTRTLLISLRNLLHETKKLSNQLTEEEKVELEKFEGILEKIELDGSSGVHNYSFIKEKLTRFSEMINVLFKKYSHEATEIY